MLKTYFFIPANRKKFIDNVPKTKADYFVFDLEDSVSTSELNSSLNNLKELNIEDNYFIRPRIFETNNQINKELIETLLNLGFTNYVLPKLSCIADFENLKEILESNPKYDFDHFKFILLVESPACLMNLQEIIQKRDLNLVGLSLGSHDYANEMGMQYTSENISFARNYLLNMAKAFELEAIDIASMIIKDRQAFADESLSAFSMGYDAKFILHPSQLKTISELDYYNPDEIMEALKVYDKLKDIDIDDFSILKIDGKIFEKPHLKRILKIINWNKQNGSK